MAYLQGRVCSAQTDGEGYAWSRDDIEGLGRQLGQHGHFDPGYVYGDVDRTCRNVSHAVYGAQRRSVDLSQYDTWTRAREDGVSTAAVEQARQARFHKNIEYIKGWLARLLPLIDFWQLRIRQLKRRGAAGEEVTAKLSDAEAQLNELVKAYRTAMADKATQQQELQSLRRQFELAGNRGPVNGGGPHSDDDDNSGGDGGLPNDAGWLPNAGTMTLFGGGSGGSGGGGSDAASMASGASNAPPAPGTLMLTGAAGPSRPAAPSPLQRLLGVKRKPLKPLRPKAARGGVAADYYKRMSPNGKGWQVKPKFGGKWASPKHVIHRDRPSNVPQNGRLWQNSIPNLPM